MSQEVFLQRKHQVLASLESACGDKSRKGSVDAAALPLVELVNGHPDMFTTSSCSGRITLFEDPTDATRAAGKKGGLWLYASHERAKPEDVLEAYKSCSATGGRAVFRFEPFILAVETRAVNVAQALLTAARGAGFRESGMTVGSGGRIMVGVRCSLRLEVPVADKGERLVEDKYLLYLVDLANEKFDANMARIAKLLELVSTRLYTPDGPLRATPHDTTTRPTEGNRGHIQGKRNAVRGHGRADKAGIQNKGASVERDGRGCDILSEPASELDPIRVPRTPKDNPGKGQGHVQSGNRVHTVDLNGVNARNALPGGEQTSVQCKESNKPLEQEKHDELGGSVTSNCRDVTESGEELVLDDFFDVRSFWFDEAEPEASTSQASNVGGIRRPRPRPSGALGGGRWTELMTRQEALLSRISRLEYQVLASDKASSSSCREPPSSRAKEKVENKKYSRAAQVVRETSAVSKPIKHDRAGAQVGSSKSWWRPLGSSIEGEQVDPAVLQRWGAASTVVGDLIITVGGYGGPGQHTRLNDVLVYDTCNDKWSTPKISSPQGAPEPRMAHAAVSISPHEVMIIGGRASPAKPLADAWILDVHTMQWSPICTPEELALPARYRHTAVAVGTMPDVSIYIFGGYGLNGLLSDTWCLSPSKGPGSQWCWRLLPTQGVSPDPRQSHAAAVLGHTMYVYGGMAGYGRHFGDLHALDLQTFTWRKVLNSSCPTLPPSCFSHSLTSYGDRFLLLLGGYPTAHHGSVFIFDSHCTQHSSGPESSVEQHSWHLAKDPSGSPTPLDFVPLRHSTAAVGDSLYVLGGGAFCFSFGSVFGSCYRVEIPSLLAIAGIIKSEIPAAIQPSLEDTSNKASWVLEVQISRAKGVKDALKILGFLDMLRKPEVIHGVGEGVVRLPVTAAGITALHARECPARAAESRAARRTGSLADAWATLLATLDEGALISQSSSSARSTIHQSPADALRSAVEQLLGRYYAQPPQVARLLADLPVKWERLGDLVLIPAGTLVNPGWVEVLAPEEKTDEGVAGGAPNEGDEHGLEQNGSECSRGMQELYTCVARCLGGKRLARQAPVANSGTRDSRAQLLLGDNGWVQHRETGVLFVLDATKCMFSSGNVTERTHMGDLSCSGEVVVDLFCGIGYYTLPMLVRAGAARVVACEWNPAAVEGLKAGLKANGVEDTCEIRLGDCRVVAPIGVADRVLLGLLPSSEAGLMPALRALRETGGWLHVHENVLDKEMEGWVAALAPRLVALASDCGRGDWQAVVRHVERVKWYAPHIRHIVVDVWCGPKSLPAPTALSPSDTAGADGGVLPPSNTRSRKPQAREPRTGNKEASLKIERKGNSLRQSTVPAASHTVQQQSRNEGQVTSQVVGSTESKVLLKSGTTQSGPLLVDNIQPGGTALRNALSASSHPAHSNHCPVDTEGPKQSSMPPSSSDLQSVSGTSVTATASSLPRTSDRWPQAFAHCSYVHEIDVSLLDHDLSPAWLDAIAGDGRRPLLLRNINLGPAPRIWTPEYLSSLPEAQSTLVSAHVLHGADGRLDFVNKNFVFRTMPLAELVARAARTGEHEGADPEERLYLRSVGSNPRKDPANMAISFPFLWSDLCFPPLVRPDSLFSTVLRVGSPGLALWTHYDVMDNILYQVRGTKRVLLWPPGDVAALQVATGSSSPITLLHDDPGVPPLAERHPALAATNPLRAVLEPNSALFIPSLWFHQVTSANIEQAVDRSVDNRLSISVNTFWRHLPVDAYEKKDLYANRDPVAAGSAEQAVTEALSMLGSLPTHYSQFYARRAIARLNALLTRDQ